MTAFLTRHLLESTLFCLLLSALACCLRKGAAARYAVWLLGISKFAVPSILLAAAGARLALLWPATTWLSSFVNQLSAGLTILLGVLPVTIGPENQFACRGLLLGWAFGVTVMFSVWFLRLRNTKYRLFRPSSQEQIALDRARKLLAIRTPVQLRSSKALAGPALQGFCRPTIVVPAGLSDTLAASEFEAVLLHELAHVRRLDNLAAVFVHALVCVFWFHPLLWIVERQLDVERERACDELVIACGISPRDYAAGIVKVCQFYMFDSAPGISAMTGADLTRRLELILAGQFSRSLSYVPRLLIAGLSVFMTMVPIAGGYCGQCVSNGQGSAGAYGTQVSNPCSPVRSNSKSSNSGSNHSCLE